MSASTIVEHVELTELRQHDYQLRPAASSPLDTSEAVNHEEAGLPIPSKAKTGAAIAAVTCSTLMGALVSGMVSVALPTMARDVNLDENLVLWPQTVNSIVAACTLLLCGSLSDVFGGKLFYLLGSVLQSAFILGFGLSKTGPQLLVFRGLMGLAQSMCIPSSVKVVMATFPAGRPRNIAFSCMGGGQPVGFAVGLVLGGVFTSTISWRVGLYISAAINAAVVVMAAVGLNAEQQSRTGNRWDRLKTEIDWVGVGIASIGLALASYVLAVITVDISNIKEPLNLTLLAIAGALVPAFGLWMHHQTKHNRPALIPNSFWNNRVFTGICLAVFFTSGGFNACEQLLSLWLQLVQLNSPLQTSLRFLPETIAGVSINIAIGLFVNRVRCDLLVITGGIVSLIAPLLMAVSGADWIYWAAGFPAMCLMIAGFDVLYTVSNLLITKQFPDSSQGLAGGVFNTAAQLGKTIGLTLSGVITTSVMARSNNSASIEALVDSYRAGFWFSLGMSSLTVVAAAWGLKRAGRIGVKED